MVNKLFGKSSKIRHDKFFAFAVTNDVDHVYRRILSVCPVISRRQVEEGL